MSLKVSSSYSQKMKPIPKPPLENKIFYLDLKMYPGEATLSKHLKFLGAKVEPLFSRCVSVVVTNKECARSVTNHRPFKVPPKPQTWSPLTPITNTTPHSPLFLNESSMDYMDSPSANSPVTDQNAIPLCRGMAMVKKAILKKQSQGTTDIIEKCKQWNVKVYHVEDILSKVGKLRQNYGAQFAAQKNRTQNGERKLKPPFLKVEEVKKRGVWYKEFPSSTFDKKIAHKVKELYNHFKTSGNIEVSIKSAQRELYKNKSYPATQSPVQTQSVSKSVSKFSESAKPSTAISVCNVKRKETGPTPVVSRKQRTSHGKKKKLYCEICKINYVHLDKHLASDTHKSFMSDPMNFLEVQNLILSLPKREDFLSSRCPLSSDAGIESNGASLSTAEVFMSPNNMKNYPNDYGYLDADFPPALYDLKRVDLPGRIDLDTEPYSHVDQHYVSPSITSQDSVYLPYLEDSYDKIMNEPAVTNKDSETPLNLSRNGALNRHYICFMHGGTSAPKTSAVRVLDFNASTEDLMTFQNSSLLDVGISVTQSLSTNVLTDVIHSHKRKLGEGYRCSISPLKKRSTTEVFNETEDNYSQQGYSFVELAPNPCSLDSRNIDSSFPNALFQEKNNISNDSGICVRASLSPPVTLDQEAAFSLPRADESFALDLSSKIINHMDVEKSKDFCCDEMPELQPLVPDETCTKHEEVAMPCLSPFVDVNNVDTPEKSGELKMTILNILSNLDCEDESQNTSQTLMAKSTDVNIDAPQYLLNKESNDSEAFKNINLNDQSKVLNEDHNAQNASQFIPFTHVPVFIEIQNNSWNSANNQTSYDDNAVSFAEFDNIKSSDGLCLEERKDNLQKIDSNRKVSFENISAQPKDIQKKDICYENDNMQSVDAGNFVSTSLEAPCDLNDSKCENVQNFNSLANAENSPNCLIVSGSSNEGLQNSFDDLKIDNNTSSVVIVEKNPNCPETLSFIDDKNYSNQNHSSLPNADGNPDMQSTLTDCKIDNVFDTKAANVQLENDSSNGKEKCFVHTCEETFNSTEMNSSEISCYSLVEEAETDPIECEFSDEF
ncbi:hypothetical protein JTE90_009335 [Oedothorax gibbosus]|uniref:DBF4-type domain-containing protein n=1 Tax=Oedothorax gibbosus TaxID=931172 RepID=A0AAV6VUP2_9ARAC|nr:hypothetical protein JTE90_009335 [Oedothorax gibbosus]